MENSGKQKILIITYYWPPAGGPGVQRWLKFAGYLPQYGFEPVVLTVDPAYASYQVHDNSLVHEASGIETYFTKTREPFNIFKKISGEKKLPVGGLESSEKNLLNTIASFIRGNIFIPDPRRGWNISATKKARELIIKFHIKTVITSSPPHSTQLIGLNLKKYLRIKWIADMRDPWTDIYYYRQFMHTSLAKRLDRSYERNVLERADIIITVSNSILKGFAKKIPLSIVEKSHIIPNGYDEEDFKDKIKIEVNNQFIITYTGTITSLYGIESLIDALYGLKDKYPDIRLRFIGTVDDDVRKLIIDKKINAITEYIPYMEHSRSIKYLYEASLLLLCIPKMEKNEGILTGKLFEYLASQKPVLCIGPKNGDAAKIIQECEAGKTFDYNEVGKIKGYLEDKINSDTVGIRKNQNYLKYSRRELTKRLTEILTYINQGLK